MTVINNTLRPGLLVSLKTQLTGGTSYFKQMLEPEHQLESGEEKARWETVRIVANREEHDRGRRAQAEARACIVRVCTNTAFGLLCPEAEKDNLTRAVAEAREIANRFNDTAEISRIGVYVITGRIAPDDVEAVKSINAEIRGLMKSMEEGIANCDVKTIREAANEARRLGGMLSPDAAGRVQVAIEAARNAARKIVKAGEEAAQEVDRAAITRLTECRTSFLDLDDAGEIAAPAAEARGVDLAPINELSQIRQRQQLEGPQLELEEAIENAKGLRR